MTTDQKTWSLGEQILQARRSDPSLDYCLWPYDAPALSNRESWQGSALLYHSFEVAGLGDKAIAFCEALKSANGPFQTVWGIKYAGGVYSWEFYFYDYARLERRFDTAACAAAIGDIIPFRAPLEGDTKPYFMYSIELTPEHINGSNAINQVDIYIGNPGSAVSSGICYGLTNAGAEMRNFYFFFDAKKHAHDIREKIKSTNWIGADVLEMDGLIWPEMSPETLVVANKRKNDAIYFSRVPVDQLAIFLERLSFPDPLQAFLADNLDRFKHLLFDVGYDWVSNAAGDIRYTKGSYYGLL